MTTTVTSDVVGDDPTSSTRLTDEARPPVTLTWLARHPERQCRDSQLSLFFPVGVDPNDETDPPYPPPAAKAICDRCKIRPECLLYALVAGEAFGVWGGTTGYQRGLLTKKIERVTCPGCGSSDVVTERSDELCLACGVSWAIL